MRIRMLAAALAALMVTGCGETGPQYLLESPSSDLRVRAAVGTLLVRTVSLPSYAADEQIAYQDTDGAVRTRDVGLWADQPERATTLNISRQLNAMTSAKVAPEPWPLPEPPQGVVDIRVETFITTRENTFVLSGQYFIGSEIPDPIQPSDPDKSLIELPAPLPDKARVFDIVIPMPDQATGSIATAQAAALKGLSEQIARDLAR